MAAASQTARRPGRVPPLPSDFITDALSNRREVALAGECAVLQGARCIPKIAYDPRATRT